MTSRLKLVSDEQPTERVFGSAQFIACDRNPALARPRPDRWRFEPTKKRPGDVVI